MQIRRRHPQALLRTPPIKESAFDAQVRAKREASVAAVRTESMNEALAFLDADPADAAGPLKDAAKGEEAATA